jgi:hypothetical protein
MTRTHILALFALVVAVPAAAVGANSLFHSDETPCFSTGNVGYRLTDRSSADFTIRIDNAAKLPDLVLQLVDDATRADFVLADGSGMSGVCAGLNAIRTIRVDANAQEPDLIVALRRDDDNARYKIYSQSADFSAQDAAALFAVMIQTGRKSAALRNLASHSDDITGSLTPRSPRLSRK